MSVIYTTGTTGRPKGILRTPITPADPPALLEVVIEAFGFGTARSTLVAAPMYHTAPNTQFQFALALGAPSVSLSPMQRCGFSTQTGEAPVGEHGDIYLRPFSAWPDFTYLGDDAKRRAMEKDGFVTVGDIGYVDADGFLYLSDRRNDMIISGGVNIFPAEIESVLLGLDGVADVAVFGIPDSEFGEAIAAHVQPDRGWTLTAAAVREHVKSRLARYKAPKVVVFEDELPREDTGKLFKRRLKAPYWEGRD
ncbi:MULTISPECIES: AMP-binding enzyme [unclassified Rhodococcus (in: high G+C Gram-positive bacteria)]|uniref:AMP-binding enzyme n=1 Tax=unclassified Rhodococcus (in: high G+C Gram-positive bacteria) TaxID=192944 RepID=UPI001BB33778|nr:MULTISPECIES: hypothetical protein [unclassified Rhodococcus (in: high G+C Gram-positive bacteria)]